MIKKPDTNIETMNKHNKPSQKTRVAGTDYQCAWCAERY
jgi:hypothetical protein